MIPKVKQNVFLNIFKFLGYILSKYMNEKQNKNFKTKTFHLVV